MRLNLREIIDMPGESVPFEFRLETDRLDFPFVAAFNCPPRAKGSVVNAAGAMSLVGELETDAEYICDRCTGEYRHQDRLTFNIPVAAELEDEENPDIFLLDGDYIDLDEVLGTYLILNMPLKHLCSEDCAGLCEQCGANLNHGPCGCRKKVDPRLAVLEQLFDNMDNQ